MKFRSIFILFDGITFVFLILVFILPVFIPGSGLVGTSWHGLWPLALFLFLVLAGMNLFFALNYRLYHLLEREDWPALVLYLEDRVLQKGRYSSHLVQILANAYLVLSDSASVMKLENQAAAAKPALLEKYALIFGAARILGKDFSGAVRFFELRLEAALEASSAGKGGGGKSKAVRPFGGKGMTGGIAFADNTEWLSWYLGFALLLDHQFDPAARRFAEIARHSPDMILVGMAAWFLDSTLLRTLPRGELAEAVREGRDRVYAALPDAEAWNKETAKIQTAVYAVILSKYIKETAGWLYPN
ncbi:hypothetical protein AGMMS49991_07580 [Spirochaetia bacterium]|nr:hypothetical protein AGMMS49991_07580 [Spirochaetia bacterium]